MPVGMDSSESYFGFLVGLREEGQVIYLCQRVMFNRVRLNLMKKRKRRLVVSFVTEFLPCL